MKTCRLSRESLNSRRIIQSEKEVDTGDSNDFFSRLYLMVYRNMSGIRENEL